MSHSVRHTEHAGMVSAFPRPNTFSEPKFGEPFDATSAMYADFDASIDVVSPLDAGVQSFGDFLIG